MGNCNLKPLEEQLPLISVEAQNENLRVFSFEELKKATKNFKRDKFVMCNDRSVRTFYNCSIDETTFAPSRTETGVTVSIMECIQNRPRALQEWQEQVESMGQIPHPNLVKIFGYCCEDNKSLLVLERLPKGSLDRYIFGKEEALPWEIRVKIATGTAQGLAYLHSVRNSTLYREIRMHNIFLDEQYNAKLFYLESDPTKFCGRHEYLTIEYMQTGLMGKKSDVHTFGVILLELLTGSEALNGINKKAQSIHDSAKIFLSDKSKFLEIIDPRLGNDYPANAVLQMGNLIKRCIKSDPMKRPLMEQVVDALNDIAKIKD